MKGSQSFSKWREALSARCGIQFTPEYARQRIAGLGNPAERSTAEFVKCYGEAYLRQVIAWFEQTTREGGR